MSGKNAASLVPAPGSWRSPTFLPFSNLRHCFLLLNTAESSVILGMKSYESPYFTEVYTGMEVV